MRNKHDKDNNEITELNNNFNQIRLTNSFIVILEATFTFIQFNSYHR